jgi:hypothetical protein
MEQLDSSLVSYLPPISQHELADIPPGRFSVVQQFLKESVPSTDIRDVLLLYQQYVDISIFAWTYMRRWEYAEVDHEISIDGSLHPGTKVKHRAGVKLL